MKKYITTIILLLGVLYIIENIPAPTMLPSPTSNPSQVELFMERIAELENPGNSDSYDAVNRYGMLGRYQFDPRTIKLLGFDIPDEEFLNSPSLQDSVMVIYMRSNTKELSRIIDEYDGVVINGTRITIASILAGAHFAGTREVKRYLASNSPESGRIDGNGTSLKHYMSKFSDFDLPKMEITMEEKQ